MVMPTPFDRLLQQTSEQAATDPAAAFSSLDALYGKAQEDLDVRRLGAMAAHIGGGALGRFKETETFLRRCLEHQAVADGGETALSLQRALGVVVVCSGRKDDGEAILANAITSPAERARIDALIAQSLTARGRIAAARGYLEQAASGSQALDANDETIAQIATIAASIGQIAETRLQQARDLACTAADTALLGARTWQQRHRLGSNRGHALVLAGRPAEALQVVQELMAIERDHQAGPDYQLFSAALAAQAQTARGQFKVAKAARAACDDLMAMVADPRLKALAGKRLEVIDGELDAALEAVGS